MSYQKSSKNDGRKDLVWFSSRTRDRCRAAHRHSSRARVVLVLVPPLFLPAHPQSTRVIRQRASHGGIKSNRRRASRRAYTCAADTKKSTSMPRRSCRFTGDDDVGASCANASAPLRAASICRRFGGGALCAGAGGGARFEFMPSARRSPAARATWNRDGWMDGWMDCCRCRRALATPPRR